jgi:NADH-quinone oxidoreductase subunit G
VRWLGRSIASLSTLDRVFVVGSFLRKDHPLFAQRIRQAVRHGASVFSLHAVQDDWAMPVAGYLSAAPSAWAQSLADVAGYVATARGVAAPAPAMVSANAEVVALGLLSGANTAILLGNAAAQHPQAAQLLALADWIGEHTGASVGYLGEAANSVGAQLVGAMPKQGGLTAAQMLSRPMKALLLLNVEPVLDAANAAAAKAALDGSGLVVAMTPFRDAVADHADVMLPIAPFSETGGSFVNAEGRLQSFHGVVKALGDSRPGWKVLRVLGNLLGLSGFAQESVEEVRAEALGDLSVLAQRLNNASSASLMPAPAATGFERVADVPVYSTDPLVRRSPSLQLTADARSPVASLPSGLWAQLGLTAGAHVRIRQGTASAVLPAQVDASLAATAVRVPAGHLSTSSLGAMFGAVTVEAA